MTTCTGQRLAFETRWLVTHQTVCSGTGASAAPVASTCWASQLVRDVATQSPLQTFHALLANQNHSFSARNRLRAESQSRSFVASASTDVRR